MEPGRGAQGRADGRRGARRAGRGRALREPRDGLRRDRRCPLGSDRRPAGAGTPAVRRRAAWRVSPRPRGRAPERTDRGRGLARGRPPRRVADGPQAAVSHRGSPAVGAPAGVRRARRRFPPDAGADGSRRLNPARGRREAAAPAPTELQVREPIEARLSRAGLPALPRTAWLELDLDALRGNLAALRDAAGPNVRVEPVVKADAYGHGAVP